MDMAVKENKPNISFHKASECTQQVVKHEEK